MADSSTFSARLSAAHAVTSAQTGAPATTAPTKSSAPSEGETPVATESSGTPAIDSLTSGADTSDKTKTEGSGASDEKAESEAKSPDDLTKGFARLSKREKKFKAREREWKKETEKKDAEFAAAKKELISEHAKVVALQRSAEQRFGWAANGERAWKNDDRVAFAKAIEKMGNGASLASITQWLAGGNDKPLATKQEPSEEEQRFRREKEEWERQRAAEREKGDSKKSEREQAQKRKEARGRLASAFAKHPFLVNPDDPKNPDPYALDEAMTRISDAMKHRKPGETAREVAKRELDKLQERELRKLKKFGVEAKPVALASKTIKEPVKQTTSGSRLPEPPASPNNGKQPTLDDTRATRIAAARRMSEQQRRGVV